MIVANPNAVVALTKVAEWLENGAPHVVLDKAGRVIDRFDMNYGVDQSSGCGTSCCIAGAIVQFEGLGDLYSGGLGFWGDHGVETLAHNFIGDDRRTLNMLFLPWDYFEPVDGENYDEQARPFSDPEKAAKVVRHYLATGEVDWTIAGFVRKSR